MFKRIAFVAVMIAGLAGVANADTYNIDRSHSSVGFSVTHLMVARVKGNFSDFSGTIQYDPADITKSAVDVTIKAYSISTNSQGRDNDLKSANFFAVDSFPTASFKSTKITKLTDKTFEIDGDLTLRGVTKPVKLNAELVGMLDDPEMGKRMGFSATTKISRKDFGIGGDDALTSGGLVVSNDVDIMLEVEAAPPRERR